MTENLNLLVTEAIMRADALADLGAPTAADAYREVSLLEERIAERLPASDAFGAIARRGAVRAACVAGDDHRARELAARYVAEENAGADLREEITALIEAAERTFTARYPRTVRRFELSRLRRFVEAVAGQGSPLRIA